MTIKEIIDGLKFTVDMFLFDPTTGETYTEPRNDMDKTTIDACKGAIELLEQTGWIPVSEKLPPIPQRVLVSATNGEVFIARYHSIDKWTFELTGISYAYNKDSIVAWMPLPEPYEAESEGKE